MVTIKKGDVVVSGGVEFHVKMSRDGEIQVWCNDTCETIKESFGEFIERCRQRGNIIIKPGDGKFETEEEWSHREKYVEVVQ